MPQSGLVNLHCASAAPCGCPSAVADPLYLTANQSEIRHLELL